jgi:dTDP-4-amino-4,6-dideoxygalactose transaminase
MLDFRRDYTPLRDEILAAITAVCDSQRFILGPEVASFEASAAQACGVPHAIGCSSGTDALWLCMAALGDDNGDSVITTPFSFFASVSSIIRSGCKPILADIDPRTFNLSPDAALEAMRDDATGMMGAIMPVHLYGQCADMDAFKSMTDDYNVHLIEDAAQAFGAAWNDKPAGSLGDIAAFSFYPTKNLSAFGDAGLVTTSNSTLAERATMLRAHGMRKRYFHDEVGWNCRIDTLQAAVLEIKLRHVTAGNTRRRELAALYDAEFRAAKLTGQTTADGIVTPWTDPRATHVFHQYVIRAPRRDNLRAHLTALGIGTEIYYPQPLHLQHALADLGYKPGDFPHAERAAHEVLALPIYPGLRNDEVETVVEAIRRFYA